MEKNINNIQYHHQKNQQKNTTFQKVSSPINPKNNIHQINLVQVNQSDEQSLQKVIQENKQSNGLEIIQQMSQNQPKIHNSANNNLEEESNINKIQSDLDESIYHENTQTASPIRNSNEVVQDLQNIRDEQYTNNVELENQSKKKKEEYEKIFLDLDKIIYEIKVLYIEEVELSTPLQLFQNLNENQLFNKSAIIPFLNQNYQDQFRCVSEKGSDFINLQCTKIIKIYKDQNQEQEYFRIPIAKILQSLEGGNDEIVKYFNIISTIKYKSLTPNNENDQQNISFFVTEIDIGQNTLYNILRLLNDSNINESQMQLIFTGLIDILLQMHSRYEVVNELQLYSIYLHQNNILFLDFFGDSKLIRKEDLEYIPEGDLFIDVNDNVDYFKKDIYNISKCLLGLEMSKQGYLFQSIVDLISIEQIGSNDNLILHAKKHNCNKYFLKTRKFIAIEEGQIILYEVQNILEEMLQDDPKNRLSSVKLGMICQKTNLLMRDINYQYMNQFPPSYQLDQEVNKKILYFPFKPIKQIQDQEDNITLIKNGQLIFKGQLDNQRKPSDICKVQIFQEYTYEGFFILGFPYLKGTLKFKDNIITEGDCYNFIFKQWLTKSKILDEVIIMNLFQISKWKRGSVTNIELDNIILAGGNKKIKKLNHSYITDCKIFVSIQSIIEKIEMISLNNIDLEVLEQNLDLERLQYVKYLVISLDSDEKAKYLIKYLNSQYCSNLEVLDLSNSNKLDYKDYELNKTLNNNQGSFTQLKTLILKNCKSTAPYQFITQLVNNQNFQKILNFYIDETFVDQNIFGMISDSPFINLRVFSLEDTSGINDNSVTQFSEKLVKFKNLKSLNISGFLRKNFNKSIFTDSNISAFKKLASQMNYLTWLEILILDDSNINDSVIDNLSRSNIPSLIKIYLRKQQKVTQKGIYYILTSQNFKNLKLINCNQSISITLPKNVSSHIELSIMNCKSITNSNISDFIKTNQSIVNLRIDAQNISSDIITQTNQLRNIKKITLFVSELADIQKAILLIKSLDLIKKIQVCINFHLSKSYIHQSDFEFLGQNVYKRNSPNNSTCLQIIQEFQNELRKSTDAKYLNDKILQNLFIHRQPFLQFYEELNSTETTDIFSFISLPLLTQDSKEFVQGSSNMGSESSIEGDNTPSKKKIIEIPPTQLPSFQTNKNIINDPSSTELQENRLALEIKKKFKEQNIDFNRIQYLEDLKTFLNSPELLNGLNLINLSPFSIGSDEIQLLTFSKHLNKIEKLILQNSLIRSQDLRLMSIKSSSLQNLSFIDLSNNKLSIMNGLVDLLKSQCIPNLNIIKLGSYKIKILLKGLTQSFRRVSVPLTLVQNLPKFNSENKIKIMVENAVNGRQYLETIDFYVKVQTKNSIIFNYKEREIISQKDINLVILRYL